MSGNPRRLQMAQALVVTGLILYVPANVLPVMTMTVVGDVEPLTVLGGVQELYDSGLAPIAAVVFLASIVVPFCKLVALSWLLLMHGAPAWQRQRGALRRIVHIVGSWSMVDIFLLSILVAVGQLGVLASVQAQPGALFFAAVLVCTLFASESYNSRMIWQIKEEWRASEEKSRKGGTGSVRSVLENRTTRRSSLHPRT